MKTNNIVAAPADPVIREVRRAKIALAEKHGFEIAAMVRALQERQQREQREQSAGPNALPRVGQP
jgi:hypothetical protein